MASPDIIDVKIVGKTYSLYDDTVTSDQYYRIVKGSIDVLLTKAKNSHHLLRLLQNASRRTITGKRSINNELSVSIDDVFKPLSKYTSGVKSHLQNIFIWLKRDKCIKTTEIQYHFYMLEAELVNRINKDNFFKSSHKIALLPHCLRDIYDNCKWEMGDVDYICRKCRKDCYIKMAGDILKNQNIHPYISVNRDHKTIFGKLLKEHGSVGVLGVACIPDLIKGLWLCNRVNIPAIGLPLDANCCMRWMGEYKRNSLNLKELESLVIG